MNRHEEGALGEHALAGSQVYGPDGLRCSQESSSGDQAAQFKLDLAYHVVRLFQAGLSVR